MELDVIIACLSDLPSNHKDYFFCGSDLIAVAVSVTGDIYFCHRFVGREEYVIGNVINKGLKSKKYLHSPALENETCVNCFAKYDIQQSPRLQNGAMKKGEHHCWEDEYVQSTKNA